MHMLYHSDSYVVVQFDVPSDGAPDGTPSRGGYEIVDRHARREIFLDGLLAEHFKQGVQALAESDPSEEDMDEFISRYGALAQQPVTLH
jgi:hypothetical protein